MQVKLAYGKHGLLVDVPDRAVMIAPTHLPALPNEKERVIEALRNPTDSLPLGERVKSSDRVAIVISDITRPTPNHKLIPWLLEELSHVSRDQIVIINGTGTHRDQTREELVAMLGEDVVETVRVINHHCRETAELTCVGRSRFGCDVYLNRAYVDADFRITTGFIEPHFFAGFSGGPKAIMPGIAGLETIQTFHNARMIGNPRSTWGNMDDNPLQLMSREVNDLCPPQFMLNVTLNGEKEITNAFAGSLAAHVEGCAFTKQHAMVRCAERFDVVVTTNSGYPLDQNLYQAVKGMSAAHQIVKQGGTIICAAECSDGLPLHGNYAKLLRMAQTPQELLALIENPDFRMLDQWQVQKQAVILSWCDVYVYSSLSDEEVHGAMLKPSHSVSDTLSALAEKYGENMSIAVLPLGPLTIPYVD